MLEDVLPDDCVELQSVTIALHAADDGRVALPKWVHLSPAGEPGHERALEGEAVVRGRDGREFAVGDVHRAISGSDLPMQFDWDHKSVLGGWLGDPDTRAAGWIDLIEFVDKPDADRPERGFWGRVDRWTPQGRSDVEDGYYRGLSPVVRYERREARIEGEPPPPPLLVGFVNVALTNRPNLKMTLLNSEEQASGTVPTPGEDTMHETLRALARDLACEPTEEQLAHAVRDLLAKRDESHRRVLELERSAAEARASAFARLADTAVGDAVKAGKITPAQVAYHRSRLRNEADIEEFHAFVATLPSQTQDAPEPATAPPQHAQDAAALAVFRNLGLTDEELEEASRG